MTENLTPTGAFPDNLGKGAQPITAQASQAKRQQLAHGARSNVHQTFAGGPAADSYRLIDIG
jgi:hypothetical protein